jgi:tetratricopeptide (TPR) repeat protein
MEFQRKRSANAEKVRELVDSAFAARYQDLTAMLRISSRAVALAEEKSHELPSDLVVAAWTQYGNAFRIAGRYQEAEKALARAASLQTSDPPTRINLLEITANLHRNTGRFDSAVRLLKSAIDAQKPCGDFNSEARIHNILGITYLDCGDRQRALQCFQTALDLLGPDAPLDVLAATGHNLLEALIADGRLAAATVALALLEPFYRRLTPARLAAKTEWLRARLYRGLNQFSAARLAYERAYELMSTEPRCPDLAELIREMAELPAPYHFPL